MKRSTVSFFLFIFLGWMVIAQTNMTWNNMRIDPRWRATLKILDFLFEKFDEGKIKKGACLLYRERLYIPMPDDINKKEKIYVLREHKLESKKEKGKEFEIIRFIPENEGNSLDFTIELVKFNGKKEDKKTLKTWKGTLKPSGKQDLWYLVERESKEKK